MKFRECKNVNCEYETNNKCSFDTCINPHYNTEGNLSGSKQMIKHSDDAIIKKSDSGYCKER